MKLIAHRGNIFGENSAEENKPEYIDLALKMGYDAEIDLRYKDHMFYLGHDEPQYHVPMTWLVKWKDKLWIHCKDLESLDKISSSPVDFNCFWHQKDDFTLTSQKYIWTYPGKLYTLRSIILMPEWSIQIKNLSDVLKFQCYGVCSDYVGKIAIE